MREQMGWLRRVENKHEGRRTMGQASNSIKTTCLSSWIHKLAPHPSVLLHHLYSLTITNAPSPYSLSYPSSSSLLTSNSSPRKWHSQHQRKRLAATATATDRVVDGVPLLRQISMWICNRQGVDVGTWIIGSEPIFKVNTYPS